MKNSYLDLVADMMNSVPTPQVPGFPKYNVIKLEDGYRLEMALAGYKKDWLSVEVSNGTLLVEGESLGDVQQYLHKGIATRKFKSSFGLSGDMDVISADFQDGILSVNIKTNVKDNSTKVEIK